MIRISAFLTIFSLAFSVNAQQSTATFELGELLIPSIRVGDQYYYNTRFINTQGLDFKVQVVNQGSLTENPTAEYNDREQTIVIESLSYEGKPYRNAIFKVISGDSIRFISTEPAYADRATSIKLPSAAIPDPDNVFLTLQMVAAVDINQDGLKDIVAHLWHANWNHLPGNAGENFYGEVPNSLAIFLQSPGRTFEFANELVLADGISDLNGSASRKQVVADFNADGYPDIAYALNREDGRLMSMKDKDYGESNWGANAAVLLSTGNG